MNPFTKFRKMLADHGLEYFNRYYGTYRGFVGSNEDPEGWGRIQLRMPQFYGNKVYQYWAWPVGLSMYDIPEEGDMVLVRFENGDTDHPLWEHGHWNKKKPRPEAAKSTKQRVFQTPSGLRMVFDDEEGKITLWKADDRVVEINKDGISWGTAGKSKEPAVLGDSNEKVLNDIISKLDTLSKSMVEFATTGNTASASGTTAPLAASFTKLLADAQQLQLAIQELKKTPKTTKSKVVTLD
jgi:uncharacterized protein involved in type VI secretion and phage assembly